MLSLLADENLDANILRGVLRRFDGIDVVRVRDIVLTGGDDPTVLAWAAEQGRVLITHDVETVTRYASVSIAPTGTFQEQAVDRNFVVRPRFSRVSIDAVRSSPHPTAANWLREPCALLAEAAEGFIKSRRMRRAREHDPRSHSAPYQVDLDARRAMC
jgi:hypothetical protein